MRVEGLAVRGVFEGVSFSLAPGEAVALVGGAGAGKSTLLRALAGFQPCEGTVDAGRRGLVFSDPEAQLSGLCSTVREEVAWGLGNLGVPRPEMASRVDAVLARLGLEAVAGRSPFVLSGGQQQRVALASILVLEPSVLLLDEPVAMLDPRGREALFEAVAGLSLIWATPSLAEAARFPRWLWLSDGRVEDGPARIPGQHRCLEAPWTREARRRGLSELPVRDS